MKGNLLANITVYKFKRYNPETDTVEISPRMATQAALDGLQNVVTKIEGSGIEIDESELDTNSNPLGMTKLIY